MLGISAAATEGFEVEHAVAECGGGVQAAQQALSNIDHEQGQIGGVGHGVMFDVHKVFEAPELFGVTEIELDLEAHPVIVNQGVVSQVGITAEKADMGLCTGGEVGLNDDDDIQPLTELLVQQGQLVDGGLDVGVYSGCLAGLVQRHVAIGTN